MKRISIRRIATATVGMVLLCLSVAVSAATVNIDEHVDGDVNSITPLGGFVFDIGMNTFAGTWDGGIPPEVDTFLFNIPVGMKLDSITFNSDWIWDPVVASFIGDPGLSLFVPPGPTLPGGAPAGTPVSEWDNYAETLVFREGFDATTTFPLSLGVAAMPQYTGRYLLAPDALPGNSPSTGSTVVDYELVFEVSVVPLPAAVWLFGSALGLLGWLRKRQAA
jgi:hypothetical protein